MNNKRFHIFENVCSFKLGHIDFNMRNEPIPHLAHEVVSETRLKNKFICVQNDDSCYASPSIYMRNQLKTPLFRDTSIYISPECKINRNMYRKSCGYKIVRDKEKADRIVVPDINPITMRYSRYLVSAHIFVYDKYSNALFGYTVDRGTSWRPLVSGDKEKDIAAIKSLFKLKEVICNDNLFTISAQLFPNCEEWKEMFDLDYVHLQKYIYESNVPLDFNNIISPELLQLWTYEKDSEFLRDNICTSNWRDYPFTMRNFLEYFIKIPMYGSVRNKEWSYVTDTIGYSNDPINRETDLIQPKDWNMFQNFLLYRNGLEMNSKGGFVPYTTPEIDHHFLRQKHALSPLFIDKPMTWQNLQSILHIDNKL